MAGLEVHGVFACTAHTQSFEICLPVNETHPSVTCPFDKSQASRFTTHLSGFSMPIIRERTRVAIVMVDLHGFFTYLATVAVSERRMLGA